MLYIVYYENKKEMINVVKDITQEQLDLINRGYGKERDEYNLWARQYGKHHLKEWYLFIDEGKILPELSYYLVSKFLEWKEGNVGEA